MTVYLATGGVLPTSVENITSVLTRATIYVTTTGNDSKTGLNWTDAKATIPAAIAALPLAADGISRNGIVEVGYGLFTVSSGTTSSRTVTLTSGNQTIPDATCTTADLGATVTGANLSVGTVVTQVNAGVSYVVSIAPTGTATESITLTYPAITMTPGLTIRGRGRCNGWASGLSTNTVTLIQDNGTGITIQLPVGSGPGNTLPFTASTDRAVLEDLSCWGTAANTVGCYGENIWGYMIRGCDFRYHGQWGIYHYANASVSSGIDDTTCYYNGTAGATVTTGGAYLGQNPSVLTVTNCRFNRNIGYNCVANNGCTFVGTDFSLSTTSAFAGYGQGTGIGIYCGVAAGNGPVTFIGCWSEGNPTLQMQIGAGHVNCVGFEFQGDGLTPYHISAPVTGTLILDGCTFIGSTTGNIRTLASWTGPIYWRACDVAAQTKGFIYVLNTGYILPVTTGPASGSWLGGFVTAPVAATSVALTSGTAWQNTTGSDVLLAVPVSFAANGDSVAVARGSTNTPTALGTVTRSAGETDVLEYYVPATWYLKATLGGTATFTANATAQPV